MSTRTNTKKLNPSIETQLIFAAEQGPWPYSHVCTIVETMDGALVAVFQSGPHEASPDQGLYYSIKSTPNSPWTPPGVALKTPGNCTMNPSLFQNKNGKIFLTFHYGGAYDGTGSCNTDNWKAGYIVSEDGGKTWKNDSLHYLPDGQLGSVKNKCLLTSQGRVLCPSSTESSINDTIDFWAGHVEITDENFQNWRKSNTIYFNFANGLLCPWSGIIQPTLFEIQPGTILALLRSGCGVIAKSVSHDGGLTFEEYATPSPLPNPNAGIDGVLMEDVPEVGLLLVFNNSTKQRDPLTIAHSIDNGNDWQIITNIEEPPGSFEYPAVIQSKLQKNVAHTCYTYTGPKSNMKKVMAYAKITF